MRLKLDSERFFFDVDGAKPRPNSPWLEEVPTVVLLPPGPGADHSTYKDVLGLIWRRSPRSSTSTREATAATAARVGSIRLPAGEEDPSCTLAGAEELAEALPQELLEFRRYANAGHGVVRVRRDALDDVARFIAS